MTGWLAFWLTWAAVGGAVELLALRSPAPADTLSEQVWRLLRRREWWARAARVVVAGALLWLTGHFTTWWG